jgi:hypothetical protein
MKKESPTQYGQYNATGNKYLILDLCLYLTWVTIQQLLKNTHSYAADVEILHTALKVAIIKSVNQIMQANNYSMPV